MIVARKRTTDQEAAPGAGPVRAGRAAGTALAGLAAVATAAAVAACGSTQAPGTAGKSPGPAGSPSSGASLQASGSGVCGAVPRLTALTVHRVNHLPQNHMKFVFPATDLVTSPVQVRAVAASLCALPRPSGPIACPMDNGVTYQLTFAEGSKKFAAVTAEASGCAIVKGLGQPRRAVPATSLWRHLGLAIGIPHPTENAFSGVQTANS